MSESPVAVTNEFQVAGMTCGHCVSAVTEELTNLESVQAVSIDLTAGRVVVTSSAPLDRSAVAAAVDEAGYELVG